MGAGASNKGKDGARKKGEIDRMVRAHAKQSVCGLFFC